MSFFIIIIIIWFVSFIIERHNSVNGTNSTIRNVFKFIMYGFTLVMLGVMIFPLLSQATNLETSEESVADGFTIDYYKVKLDVKEDVSVDVEEDIGINFYEDGHHGILKFTPEWLRYTSKSGKTVRRKSTVSNYRAEDPKELDDDTYDYSVDIVNKKPRIKIGSPYKTLDTGLKDYVIKYTYDMGSDPYAGYDEFIFHAYGDFWGTEIKNPSIEVNMPKSIKGSKVHFFMDKKRKCDVTEAVDYGISDNRLIASFNKPKYERIKKDGCPSKLEKSLTVDIELPDNYFVNGTFNYGFKSLICIIITIIITLFTILLWFLFGKDYEKKAKVVNYMPPRDLSAAEVGYIDSNNYSKKLVVSLIVELASKKMIKIREDKDGNIIIKGYKPNKKDKDYEKKKKEYDDKVKALNPYEQIVIEELIKGDSEIHLKEHQTFYTVFKEIENKLDHEYRWILNEKVSYVLKYACLGLVSLSAFIMYNAYRNFEDLAISLYPLYYVGFISVFVTFFFSIFMTRKSRYGEDIKVEINGFKDFLELVEKDKLEELVEKMPDYFYQILPYTYVLNLSRKWIEKFEDIKMPEVKINDINMDMFDSITDQVYTPMPVSSGGGGCSSCSSCGGGCSSCGGGCSSCGGGGSW